MDAYTDTLQSKLFKEIVCHQGADEQLLHQEDVLSLWFSIDKGKKGRLRLEEFPRFSNLVGDHQKRYEQESPCFAQLVSFIGNTGAGKSTLIRVLMKQPWDLGRLAAAEEVSVSLPIAGRSGSTIPTTGDVHLYPGPDATRPGHLLLYADCEGFNGGNQEPVANEVKRSAFARIRQLVETKTIESLAWAKQVASFLRGTNIFPLDLEGTREKAVSELFPRLLYNFSDVVVHVVPWNASRMMEHVIVKLLEWAQNSQKTAVNRAILPHLIVVLNMSPGDITDWDASRATTAILDEHLGALESNPIISTYRWMLNQLRNTPITTVRELLKDCYSSVEFIPVPGAENQHLFSQQVRALDSLIYEATEQAKRTKIEARGLLNSETQDLMFKKAFEHYRNNLERPFDFLESLLASNPLDHSLSATFFELLRAAMIAYQSATTELSATEFCSIITPAICSTIALDSYRSNGRQPGRWEDIYNGSALNSRVGDECNVAATYKFHFGESIAKFMDLACQCEFVFEGKRCVNFRRRHGASRHQDSTGKVMSFGTFESTFVDEGIKTWNEEIKECFGGLDDLLESSDVAGQYNELMAIWSAHYENLRNIYSRIPELNVTKIETCSWCFHGEPLKVLECRHQICWTCAQLVGDLEEGPVGEGKAVIAFERCDLHPTEVCFGEPNYIIKERETGAVVLSSQA
ncbi:hypothetical protein ACJ41O_011855 [Fusarium nematophilum]